MRKSRRDERASEMHLGEASWAWRGILSVAMHPPLFTHMCGPLFTHVYGSTFVSILFLKAHPLVFGVLVILRVSRANWGHSGYCFSGTWMETLGLTYGEQTALHDHHHTVNSGGFGAHYTDWMYGTMDAYVQHGGLDGYIEAKRGRTYEKRVEKEKRRSFKEGGIKRRISGGEEANIN